MFTVAELELVAGNTALDFLNTIEERLEEEPQDVVRTPEDLAEWGQLVGILDSGAVRGRTRSELDASLALRTHLTAILDDRFAGRPARTADLEALAGAVADAHAAGKLEPGSDGTLHWTWDRGSLSSVRHVVATEANDVLSGPAVARIGQCAGPGCGWFFLDTTKRGNRRWCTMRDCGQDAKTARRRSRSRPSS